MAGLLIVSPLFLSIPVYGVMLPSLLKARTIGELIVTLFAGAGTAITNPVVLPQIYQSAPYSIEYLIEEDILNLTDYPEYTNEQIITELGSGKAFNLDTTSFRELMETNWQSMVDYQIDAVFRLNEIANTDSVYGAIDNLGGFVTDVAKYGYLGFENSIAIVTNPLTAVKVGMENVREAVKNILGLSINDPTGELRLTGIAPNGMKYAGIKSSNENASYYNYLVPEGCYIVIWKINNTTSREYYIVNSTNNNQDFYQLKNSNNVDLSQTPETIRSISAKSWRRFAAGSGHANPEYPVGDMIFYNGNENGLTNLLNNLVNNGINIPNNYMIGKEGNYNSSETGISEGQGIDIIDSSTYNDFVDAANENTDNGDYEDNAILYDDLINQNTTDIPEPEPEPIIPVQPTDYPVRPTITPEQNAEGLIGAVPGITDYFPFCIPGDLVALFGHLNITSRKAPIITWEWNVPGMISDQVVEIDLSKYDSVAMICRLLELIAFIYGLIVGTRAIIGA